MGYNASAVYDLSITDWENFSRILVDDDESFFAMKAEGGDVLFDNILDILARDHEDAGFDLTHDSLSGWGGGKYFGEGILYPVSSYLTGRIDYVGEDDSLWAEVFDGTEDVEVFHGIVQVAKSMQPQTPETGLPTISYDDEAYDTFRSMLHSRSGWIVTVTQNDGTSFVGKLQYEEETALALVPYEGQDSITERISRHFDTIRNIHFH